MKTTLLFVLSLIVIYLPIPDIVLSSAAFTQQKPAATAKYDPKRDPEKDIQDAIAEAGQTGKRILLEVGGEWCVWCHIMDRYFETNPKLLEFREANFVMVKINFSRENENQKLLSRYPEIQGYPHIFVLDSNGKLLHSQNTGQLESGKSYDLEKFSSFLKRWARRERQSPSSS
ncbi:MAG: thioredoxin family protein [Blastocatellia bacterium]